MLSDSQQLKTSQQIYKFNNFNNVVQEMMWATKAYVQNFKVRK